MLSLRLSSLLGIVVVSDVQRLELGCELALLCQWCRTPHICSRDRPRRCWLCCCFPSAHFRPPSSPHRRIAAVRSVYPSSFDRIHFIIFIHPLPGYYFHAPFNCFSCFLSLFFSASRRFMSLADSSSQLNILFPIFGFLLFSYTGFPPRPVPTRTSALP